MCACVCICVCVSVSVNPCLWCDYWWEGECHSSASWQKFLRQEQCVEEGWRWWRENLTNKCSSIYWQGQRAVVRWRGETGGAKPSMRAVASKAQSRRLRRKSLAQRWLYRVTSRLARSCNVCNISMQHILHGTPNIQYHGFNVQVWPLKPGSIDI